MLLYLIRKYGSLSQDVFQWDSKLTQVLNEIDAGRFDEARHVWLMHLLRESGSHDFNLTGETWDLWSDSVLFTSVCELFQLQARTLFGPCKVVLEEDGKKTKKRIHNDSCPYNSAYSEESSLATVARQDSHVTVYYDQYNDIQSFFTAEYNTFGKKDRLGNITAKVNCGEEITLYQKEHGCKGRRMKRTQLVNPPVLLEIMLYSVGSNAILNTSEFEHELEINENHYTFGGALLFNGIHYQSLCVVHDRFVVYDGMGFGGRSKVKLKYLKENCNFGSGWAAKKLWYVLDKTSDACRIGVSHPVGISIGPMREQTSNSSVRVPLVASIRLKGQLVSLSVHLWMGWKKTTVLTLTTIKSGNQQSTFISSVLVVHSDLELMRSKQQLKHCHTLIKSRGKLRQVYLAWTLMHCLRRSLMRSLLPLLGDSQRQSSQVVAVKR